MARTESTMLALGSRMPEFSLPDYDGNNFSSSSLKGKPVIVVFMCNHCPFVQHIIDVLAEKAADYAELGVAVVGINANDVENFPEDSPELMKEFAQERGISFPYLYDESQETAKAFRAACTPDIFLFDAEHRLVYRGQFDGARPSLPIPVTGSDLTAAVTALVTQEPQPEGQKPSLGCNIKWKEGNEPDYFG